MPEGGLAWFRETKTKPRLFLGARRGLHPLGSLIAPSCPETVLGHWPAGAQRILIGGSLLPAQARAFQAQEGDPPGNQNYASPTPPRCKYVIPGTIGATIGTRGRSTARAADGVRRSAGRSIKLTWVH
jgi:hypothetical protein